MTFHVKQGGVVKKVNYVYVKQGGVVKKANTGWVKQSGSVKQFYTDISGAPVITPSSWNQIYPEGSGVQQQIFNVSASFGTGPYTYVWAYESITGGAVVLTSGQGTSTATFQVGVNATGRIRCTVTDSLAVALDDTSLVNITFGTPP